MRAPFCPNDKRDLVQVVFGISVTTIDAYVQDIRTAGFADVTATDLTSDWATYAADRLEKWRSDHVSYARVYGEGAYAAQEKFYAVIARLYESSSLGGVRLVGSIPLVARR